MFNKIVFKLIFAITLIFSGTFSFASPSNGEWITVSGKVIDAHASYFVLDKGSKRVIVEMDDWDWYKEGYNILKGDKVLVYGRIDKDFLEKRTIEASSVFVKGLNTYFYASSDDEEPEPHFNGIYYDSFDFPEALKTEFTGHVEKINGDKFTFNLGARKIIVNTSMMPYNPMNKKNLGSITVGDKLKVYGNIEDKLFSKDELDASWIVILKQQ